MSELSLGAWITYGGQVSEDIAEKCMAAAYEAGVNFFDNAEAYARGKAEIVMGNVIEAGLAPRVGHCFDQIILGWR